MNKYLNKVCFPGNALIEPGRLGVILDKRYKSWGIILIAYNIMGFLYYGAAGIPGDLQKRRYRRTYFSFTIHIFMYS